MKVVELFCGTKSFSKNAEALGFECFTLDIDNRFKPDLCLDFMDLKLEDIPSEFMGPGILWASPPCTFFSMLARDKHFKGLQPLTHEARLSVSLIQKLMFFITLLKPTFFFIENPLSRLRRFPFMYPYVRRTVNYCQYGDDRFKPTDIWTNYIQWRPRARCKRGMNCHSSDAVQMCCDSKTRSIVPDELCQEILMSIKGGD